MEKRTYLKEQICNFLMKYHHLEDNNYLEKAELTAFVEKIGCIQYDPLNVVGRNADLVLQSRMPSYRKDDISHYLYTERTLFDVWDKNMSMSSMKDWHYFEHNRKKYLTWCQEHQEEVSVIFQYLQKHDFANAQDFSFESAESYQVGFGWHGKQNLGKATLEAMTSAGITLVHHREGTRKYYCLAEKYIPADLNKINQTFSNSAAYFEWAVLRRINSVGILWDQNSDAWLGIIGMKKQERAEAFNQLLAKGKIVSISVEEIATPLYIGTNNLQLLQKATEHYENKRIRLLAPLDHLLWDRQLIAKLFNFDYKWEVYTPIKKRKYGYYVLPVIFNNRFIARVEPVVNQDNLLTIKNWWWEPDIAITQGIMDAVETGLKDFSHYLKTDGIDEKSMQNIGGK